jgi:hypothetical protein
LVLLLGYTGTVFAQQPTEEEMAEMMKNMMPGEIHEWMAQDVGEWKAEMRMYMDPSMPPMETEMKAKSEMILGNRYLVSRFSGNMMGMPFEGVSTTAYDNGSGIFYSSWIDNSSTGMTQMKGKWVEKGKVIEYVGVSQDPMSGTEVRMKEVMTYKDKDTQLMEMFMEVEGDWVKSLEIRLTRM